MGLDQVNKDLVQESEIGQGPSDLGLNKVTITLKKGIVPISRWVNTVGVAVLALMMFLTTADVVLRYIFSKPITGSLELTQYMMVILVAFALAYTAVNKGHITVDVVTQHFSPRVRAVINSINSLFNLGIFGLITWRSIVLAQGQQAGNFVSSALDIPVYPFVYIVAAGSAIICLVFIYNFLEQFTTVISGIRRYMWVWLLILMLAVLAIFSIPVWAQGLQGQLGPITAGIISIVLLIVLLFSEMPIGVTMGLLGFLGIVFVIGLKPGLTSIGTTFYGTASSYSLSVIPLFILMGLFCYYSGISKGLYRTVYKWIGHLPGGLALATIGACAGFAAVSGSSVATAATMGTVSLPEMKRYRYSSSLATGAIAAGGCLGVLIPPSIILAVYGLLTEQSIGKLFLAGFIPGILEAILFMIAIYITCKRDPLLGPPGERSNMKERIISLKDTWAVLLLFVLVIGGLYAGVFTPTEAAGVGAFGAFIIAIGLRKLSWGQFKSSLLETGSTTAMIFVILIGANILGYFFAVARLPAALSDYMSSIAVNRYFIMAGIIFVYLFLGCIISSMAMIVLTVPIFFPIIVALGFDPIWFGIIIVKVVEVGQLTPPVGINVFVIQGIAKDVPMYSIFRGIVPFLIADIFEIILLVIFPQIATFLPDLMK